MYVHHFSKRCVRCACSAAASTEGATIFQSESQRSIQCASPCRHEPPFSPTGGQWPLCARPLRKAPQTLSQRLVPNVLHSWSALWAGLRRPRHVAPVEMEGPAGNTTGLQVPKPHVLGLVPGGELAGGVPSAADVKPHPESKDMRLLIRITWFSDSADPHYVSDPLPRHHGIIIALGNSEP